MRVKFCSRWLDNDPVDWEPVVCEVDVVPAVGDYFNPSTDDPYYQDAQSKGFISRVEFVVYTPGGNCEVEVYGYRVMEYPLLACKDGDQ